jgi:hypothetical protein
VKPTPRTPASAIATPGKGPTGEIATGIFKPVKPQQAVKSVLRGDVKKVANVIKSPNKPVFDPPEPTGKAHVDVVVDDIVQGPKIPPEEQMINIGGSTAKPPAPKIAAEATPITAQKIPPPRLPGESQNAWYKRGVELDKLQKDTIPGYSAKYTVNGARVGPRAILRAHALTAEAISNLESVSNNWQYLMKLYLNDYSSAYDADVLLYNCSQTQPEINTSINYTLDQLAAYDSVTMQPVIATISRPDSGFNTLTGSNIKISTPVAISHLTAMSVGIPPFIPMRNAAFFPNSAPDDPADAAPLQPPWNYNAFGWQVQYFLNQGTNYPQTACERDTNGSPCQVLTKASPLHVLQNYLWTNTTIGAPKHIYNRDRNEVTYDGLSDVQYSSAYLTVDDARSTLYLGNRPVSYTLTANERPNYVFSGASNFIIKIPTDVDVIPNFAFCSTDGTDGELPFNIQSVTLNPNTQRIGTQAFFRAGVKNLFYPASITSFGNRAFAACGLQNVVAYTAPTTQYTSVQKVTVDPGKDLSGNYTQISLIKNEVVINGFKNTTNEVVIKGFTNATIDKAQINGANNILTATCSIYSTLQLTDVSSISCVVGGVSRSAPARFVTHNAPVNWSTNNPGIPININISGYNTYNTYITENRM